MVAPPTYVQLLVLVLQLSDTPCCTAPVVPSLHSREYTRAQATIEQQNISQIAATKRAKAEEQQLKSVIAALSDEMSALYKVGTLPQPRLAIPPILSPPNGGSLQLPGFPNRCRP